MNRPNSAILPIVRTLLITKDGGTSCFTCIAAERAYDKGMITMDELFNIQDAINSFLADNTPPSEDVQFTTLIAVAYDRGMPPLNSYLGSAHPSFFPVRDALLDELQKKLEA